MFRVNSFGCGMVWMMLSSNWFGWLGLFLVIVSVLWIWCEIVGIFSMFVFMVVMLKSLMKWCLIMLLLMYLWIVMV